MSFKLIGSVLAFLMVPAALPAQEVGAPAEHTVFVLNTFLFLVCGFLVFWMAAGFTMLEAGLVRCKNVSTQLTKNLGLFAVAGIMYWLVGYNLMYPLGNWIVGADESGGYLGSIGLAVLEEVGISAADADDIGYASTGSDFFFQLMFCAATASIVSGALAERIRVWPFLLFTAILTGIVYPIQASWKWGGGFLDSQFGFLDFAGSTVVHSVGGWAALAGAIFLGARHGKYKNGRVFPILGSNLPLATLGTFILWIGWFGFNGGSQLALGSVGDSADVSRIFANTNMAAMAGGFAAMVITQLVYKRMDLTIILNGILAGLVAITAEPLTPNLFEALVIGGIGGAIVVFGVPLLDRFQIDDVVGAIPVHLFAGIWGTLAVLVTNPDATLLGQLLPIIIVGVAVFGTSCLLWYVLKTTIGIRVDLENEINGLDHSEMAVDAYPEFTS